MDACISAVKDAQDADACKDALRDLTFTIKARKGQGMDKLPQGTVKAVCSQMNGHLASYDLVVVGLTCLSAIMSTPSRAGMLLRLEGGVKTLAQAVKKHAGRSKVAGLALKLVLRACANSPQTLLAVMKEKGFVSSILDSFQAHVKDSSIVCNALELCVLLTRYEKGARLLAGEVFVETCSQVMLAYVGQWDLFGHVLKSIKNIAKFEEPRNVLLRDTEVTQVLLGTSRVVARVHDRPKLLKRTYRGLWMLSPGALSPMPEPEADVAVAEEDVNADLPSAMDCAYDRDCQLFPELLDDQSQLEEDNTGCMDENGHVPLYPVREFVHMAEQPLAAEQFAASSLPYSSQPDPYHTGGACLVAEMMVHKLQRISNRDKVQNTIVFDNQFGCLGAAAGAPAAGRLPALRFESRFEGGNLRAAALVYDNEYDLWLSTDINEREDPGHRQWFYFALTGAQPGEPYRFNLVNMVKKDSLVNHGLSPLIGRGLAAAARKNDIHGGPDGNIPANMQWKRACDSCCYYPSPYRSAKVSVRGSGGPANGKAAKGRKGAGSYSKSATKVGNSSGSLSKLTDSAGAPGPSMTDLVPTSQLIGRGLHCLTFTATFATAGTYYVAMCFPYSYTDIQDHLSRVTLAFRSGLGVGRVARRSLLCRSLSRHRCDLLTITDFCSEETQPGEREYVIFTSRVHPGETNASWVMKGVIDFLTSQHPTARSMRQSFIFKIVPCLNPDGVINGNYRCSLSGMDLNRTWDKPDKVLHPTIWHTRALVQRLASTGRLALFCDLHGHSRREDAFFYGCDPAPAAGAEAKAPALVLEARRDDTEVDADSNAGAARALSAKDIARLRVRMLPYLMAKIDPGVSLSKCSFKVARSKMSTGRVVVCRQLRVAGAYTLETSLGGCSKTGMHFGGADLMRLGRSLCEAIAELADADEEQLLNEMAADIDLGRSK